MLHFSLFDVFVGADGVRSVGEGPDHSKFVFQWLVAVELEVLVRVSGFSVHAEGEATFCPCDQRVQHGTGAVLLDFSGEFDGRVLAVEMR